VSDTRSDEAEFKMKRYFNSNPAKHIQQKIN